MSDLEQAQVLLTMARKDHRALVAMRDPEAFAGEIFGFHVQQAVEKALKAWLCCIGATYPKMHDLAELAALLNEAHQKLPDAFAELLDYTDFAVTFRYDAFPEFEAQIDRERTTALVTKLLGHVCQIYEKSAGG